MRLTGLFFAVAFAEPSMDLGTGAVAKEVVDRRVEHGAVGGKAHGDGAVEGDDDDDVGRPAKRPKLGQHEDGGTVESLLLRLDSQLSEAGAYVSAQISWASLQHSLAASAADAGATAHELMGGVAAARATAALATVIPAGGRVSGGNDVPWWSSKPGAPVGTPVTGSKGERAVTDRTDLELAETVCRVWREDSDDSAGSLYDGEPVKPLTDQDFRNGKWY